LYPHKIRIQLIGKGEIMQIKILGSGCANCKTLFRRTEDALKELNIHAELIKVEDIQGIMSYGIMSTPGLVIDEKVVSQGRVPSVDTLKGVILEARGVEKA
jgi:small redox-active disulfide protein 2